eukprot:CAMPEP_0202447628 /NCGR_PEP_ID=MMETSP1360-20130828/6403_1 /ASSEMBLY_ACC=CAM_ASM_000848 /TAXON_ID=515479 /ORGANISM="Licmophora paradoxa, Strain CCMP2313" /LENGTH=285 /DNA_ID=CAMNT_0049064817 /DNA_START=96 /DNA_END=953 /DNA_ORIENTATION=+
MYFRRETLTLLGLLVAVSDGFALVGPSSLSTTTTTTTPSIQNRLSFTTASPFYITSSSSTQLFAAEEEEAASATEQETETAETEEAEEAVEEEEVKEDPEVVALKAEIANYESQLRAKQAEISKIAASAEYFSKGGYQRRVAQTHNTRTNTKLRDSDNTSASTAVVVQKCLPILDELRTLKESYGETSFGSSYASLTNVMATSLSALGFKEYEVDVGGPISDPSKAVATQEEHSEVVPKGGVIRTEKMGMEVDGNVMRLAEVVVSLGKEGEEEEEAPAEGEEAQA